MYHGQSIVGKELFWLNLFCFNNQNEHSSRFTSVSAIRNTSFKLCACVRFDRLFSQYPAQRHNSMHERAYVLHVHDSLSCMYVIHYHKYFFICSFSILCTLGRPLAMLSKLNLFLHDDQLISLIIDGLIPLSYTL